MAEKLLETESMTHFLCEATHGGEQDSEVFVRIFQIAVEGGNISPLENSA